nr:universal stress protein [Haloquadratum walsbyi]
MELPKAVGRRKQNKQQNHCWIQRRRCFKTTRAKYLILTDEDSESNTQTVRTITEFGQPVETIQEAADTYGVDQIVIGSHGRAGLQRIIVGSVAENVMRGVSIPVTIVR